MVDTVNNQANYEKALAFVLKAEGGYVKWDEELGGATNRGITLNTLQSYRRRTGAIGPTDIVTPKDVAKLTKEEASTILEEDYWNVVKANEIADPNVALLVFNEAMWRNPKLAAKSLQKSLGVPVDGIIGANTIEAVNALDEQASKQLQQKLLDNIEESIIRNGLKSEKKQKIQNGLLSRVDAAAVAVGLTPKARKMLKRKKKDVDDKNHQVYFDNGQSPDELDAVEDLRLGSGSFRFNNLILNIPPESISIVIDEYESSYLMLRQDTPVTVQNGKKKIRIIANFPVDISDGTNGLRNLATMLIQIRKTPIATIENEKIRKELLGDIKDFDNIGVVVDNISGYVDEDYPSLIRCTLQMSWFNHTPYVSEIKYVNELPTGEIQLQKYPSLKFKEFYQNGTVLNNTNLVNDPNTTIEGQNSLTILYKEYKKHNLVFRIIRDPEESRLIAPKKEVSKVNFQTIQTLKQAGWYLAEEDEKKWDEPVEGIFYRWRKFEIPFTDLDTSGALILQNMSFSLSTNASYINMEQHSVPTIQFLGGSSSSLRAMVFAAAEYDSENNKMPIGTSSNLGELQTILKIVSENRIKYPKFAKENHLLIAHPLAKLMKYKAENSDKEKRYVDELGNTLSFSINNFLPVIVSNVSSNTVNGLPFASRIQLDFKETRFGKRNKAIKARGQGGSVDGRSAYKKIVDKLAANFSIAFDPKAKGFTYKATSLSADSIKAGLIVTALNNLRGLDKTVTTIDQAFASPMFFLTADEMKTKAKEYYASTVERTVDTNYIEEYKSRFKTQRERDTLRAENKAKLSKVNKNAPTLTSPIVFNFDFVSKTIMNFYVAFMQSVLNGEEWTKSYIDEFQEFSTNGADIQSDLYPDMMIPVDQYNPAFYFANNQKRIDNYRNQLVQGLPEVSAATDRKMIATNLNPAYLKIENADSLQKANTIFPTSYNQFTYQADKQNGLGVVHATSSIDYRIINSQKTVRDMTTHGYSLNQVYPTFQVQLISDRYSFLQKLSAADIKSSLLFEENQKDLLDIFDLSSILDIRIIKDEHEAADVMVIRVLTTDKKMVNKKQETYFDADTFSVTDLMSDVWAGKSSVQKTFDSNLERAGLKEGIKIKALLGYVNEVQGLSVEFSGRIASINGSDILEIYCVGNGHELIQNTLGFDKDSSTFKFNSDSTDLMAKLLGNANEVKSFGNTKFEVGKGIAFDFPLLAGGRSALDNIYAPSLVPSGKFRENFNAGIFNTTLKSITYATSAYGLAMAIPLIAGTILAGTTLGSVALLAGIVGTLAGAGKEIYSFLAGKLEPAQFTIFQQTIWDVMQELTLRHPGTIISVVPFDNRSTIFFGEPDGTYFHRGPISALDKTLKDITYSSSRKTLREISDQKSDFADMKTVFNLDDPTMVISNAAAKERLKSRKKKLEENIASANLEQISLDAMQKCFRNYHLVTSEHDIVSNQIEASSKDVANSVQVYHPKKSGDVNFDGSQYIEDYELTDPMKADDDLYSHLINNKVFTFHNAHNDDKTLELPQKYAKAILCKELSKIYQGKIVILGRPGVKPHDIIVLRDTYNQMSGPVGVRRVVQTISPETGWITVIYPKFLAIPDNSAGAFQMANILKGCRFWLTDEMDLFYSSMEKFNPSDTVGSSKQAEDLDRAIQTIFYPDKNLDISKETAYAQGEENIAEVSRMKTEAGVATTLAGQAAGGPIGTKFLASAGADLGQAAAKGIAAKNAALLAVKERQVAKGILNTGGGLLGVGWSGVKGVTKVGAGALSFVGGFALDYLLDSAIEGFISWAKYRQPVYIFPLKKEGRPWMAALNGFKENTPIEHFQNEATNAGDMLGSYSLYIRDFISGWVGGQPNVTRVTLNEKVAKIVDGDTIHLQTGEQIRISGYDSAESKAYDFGDGKKIYVPTQDEKDMAKAATALLTKLVQGKNIKVERVGKDIRGVRTVANLYLEDGTNITQAMLDSGLVIPYDAQYKGSDDKRAKEWSNLKKKAGI